ncbi:DUF3613 domain-containing protein [Stenotrophomonas sp. 24(2023)]|uniref:DUF3613 domain-containing protein n=1 Tax=Stenotrophomonas sp. 24(2023) TaxID=3068324 RepID=UPI0027E1071D|nr:DUF3613 domain-containing protein [Stenotrophomonas sp. 24(2023)]WMJ69498.1 DUF3613 domain-containing protein [Stenotrophomonas sp. 24(2023)]
MTRLLLPCLLLALAGTAHAQQAPLTGRMLGGQAPVAAPAPPATAPAAETYPLQPDTVPVAPLQPAAVDTSLPSASPVPSRHAPQIGDTTRSLLRLQAAGTQAGRRLPILGDQATLSYARYLKSFEHEIPDFFENKVDSSSSGGLSGR